MNNEVFAQEIMIKDVITIDPWQSLTNAAELMNKNTIGSLPVVDSNKLVGIITSRDIRSAHPNRLVADAMTKNVITIGPNTQIWEIKQLLETHQIEKLPVVNENTTLVGLVNKGIVHSYLGMFKDSLTGLPRTSYIFQIIGTELKKAADISVIFMDINNFGEIDKTLGHTIGDHILQKTAQILQDIKPSDGYLCRYGGDEFAYIFPWPQKQTIDFALNIKKAISNTTYFNDIKVTLSIGIAGGNRQSISREADYSSMLNNLFNMASLASTKAKKDSHGIVVAKELSTLDIS